MRELSSRTELRLVALGYAAVFAVSAVMLYGRHLQELRYPAEASGGMWAFGDAALYVFIVCLFMIPNAFVIWVAAKFERVYAVYSQFLLGLSLTAPVCLSLFLRSEGQAAQSLRDLCLYRLLFSPFVLAGMGTSRLVARFDRAKRLISYALLVEALTLGASLALLVHAMGSSGR